MRGETMEVHELKALLDHALKPSVLTPTPAGGAHRIGSSWS